MPLQIRRGTEAERQTLASPLVSGELLWITDDRRLYIGDGTTLAKDLVSVTGYNREDAQDDAAALFTSGVHSGISFTYDDSNDRINATISIPQLLQNLDLNGFNISGTGNLVIDGTISGEFIGNFQGSVFSDDSTLLINGPDSSINLDGTVKGNIVPDQDSIYDLGSPISKFRDLYLSGSSLYLGNAVITSTGSAINLPLGSTINGIEIGTTELPAGSTYNINIVGDDSTSIINTSTLTVTADGGFLGDLRGSVFADNSTVMVNAITGELNASNMILSGELTDSVGNVLIDATTGEINPTDITLSGVLTDSIGTVLLDTTARESYATLFGDSNGIHFGSVIGDIKGSVFADDSSIMIDAIDRTISASSIVINNDLVIENGTITNNDPVQNIVVFNQTAIDVKSDYLNAQPGIRSTGITDGVTSTAITAMYGSRGSLTSPAIVNLNDNYALTLVSAHNGTNYVLSSALTFTADTTPTPGASSIGTKFSVLVADGTNSLLSTNKQMTFDSAGTLSAPVMQVGTFTAVTPSDTRPGSPAAGMIIFVSDASAGSKFQGWDGSSWVSLG